MLLHHTHTPPPPSLVHSEYSLLYWPQVTPTRGGRNESHFSKCLQNGSRFARVVPLVEARASVRLCAKGDKVPPWSRMSVSALCTIRSSEARLERLALGVEYRQYRRRHRHRCPTPTLSFPRLSIDVITSASFLFEGTITQQLASCLSSATHRPSGHGRRAGRPRRSNYVPKTEEGSSYFLIFYGAPARARRARSRGPASSVCPAPPHSSLI